MKRLRIATRPSKLAIAQALLVADTLKKVSPGTETAIIEVSSAGDRDSRDFLQKAPTAGFFTSEVEAALLTGAADIAVHSLKDLPTASNAAIVVAAIPTREEVCDIVVAPQPLRSFDELPRGARVGTSSLRRMAQLLHVRPDLNILPIRGNVETRIAKMDRGDYDAIVLAAAGLNRLHLASRISLRLKPDEFLIAPGQGALAVQVRKDDMATASIVAQLDHRQTSIAVTAEREILSALHGGCSIPLGVHSKMEGDSLMLSAILATSDGKHLVRASVSGTLTDGIALARQLAAKLLASATPAILACIRPA